MPSPAFEKSFLFRAISNCQSDGLAAQIIGSFGRGPGFSPLLLEAHSYVELVPEGALLVA